MDILSVISVSEEEKSHQHQDIEQKDFQNFQHTGINIYTRRNKVFPRKLGNFHRKVIDIVRYK